ncbi:MULTIPLE CHLOROPLAST DIVISION SITE 1-like protein [Drosera capensis]
MVGDGEIEGDLKEAKVVDLGGNAGVGDEATKRVVRFREMVVVLPRLPFASSTFLALPMNYPIRGKKTTSGQFFHCLLYCSNMLDCCCESIYVLRKEKEDRPGTVADLVRRGQLRSDRRGISQPLIYDDPFNNPLMKTDKGNSTVEICGKVYPFGSYLTHRTASHSSEEEVTSLSVEKTDSLPQRRRPPVPPVVDPDTVQWIPANHPFATTSCDIDEALAQTNVYHMHGVPFRIRAEHEALQKKLEALQKASPGDFRQLTKSVHEQKLNVVIDPVSAKHF